MSQPKVSPKKASPVRAGGVRLTKKAANKLLDIASECAVQGDTAGAVDVLAQYLAKRTGSYPDLDSIARGVWRNLGRLPAGHIIPETVSTASEFLEVLAANQDSPQRELNASYHLTHCNAKYLVNSQHGHVRIKLRMSAILNYGVEQEGAETLGGEDITGRHCAWEDSCFAMIPTGSSGVPWSIEQREAVTRESGRALIHLCRLADKAKRYGFVWQARRDVIESTVKQYRSLKVPLPDEMQDLTLT